MTDDPESTAAEATAAEAPNATTEGEPPAAASADSDAPEEDPAPKGARGTTRLARAFSGVRGLLQKIRRSPAEAATPVASPSTSRRSAVLFGVAFVSGAVTVATVRGAIITGRPPPPHKAPMEAPTASATAAPTASAQEPPPVDEPPEEPTAEPQLEPDAPSAVGSFGAPPWAQSGPPASAAPQPTGLPLVPQLPPPSPPPPRTSPR